MVQISKQHNTIHTIHAVMMCYC